MKFAFYNFFGGLKYRNFNKKSAKKWAYKYKQLSDDLSEYSKRVVSHYCKEDNPSINKKLRNNQELNQNAKKYILTLDNITSNKIAQNITVYRKINQDLFVNGIYKEKGYMSTSLVNGEINHIHKGNYLLKIFIPASSTGFYVDFISCREGEYEMLLSRNIKLKKIAQKKQKHTITILCTIVN